MILNVEKLSHGFGDRAIFNKVHVCKHGSQTAGAKFRGQKGKSPDRQLRSQRDS